MEFPSAGKFAESIEKYIAANTDTIVADMRKILTFETVSGGATSAERETCKRGIVDGFAWIRSRAVQTGFDYRGWEDLVCVVEQKGGDKTLGVLLHLDVVPPGEGWKHPPFSGTLDDGVIYGRGCQDDKGPIVEMFHALAAVKSLGFPMRRTVRLIIGSEEETGKWIDVKRYRELEPAPDECIVPDAIFPIVNGEKGMADIRMEIAPFAYEDGPLRLRAVRAGTRSNIVPHRCEVELVADNSEAAAAAEAALRAFLDQREGSKAEVDRAVRDEASLIRILFHGKNAHGSTPWEGHNAARDAVFFLASLPGLTGPRADFVRFLATIIPDDYGADMGIGLRHDFIGRTTQNMGVLSITDNAAHALLNIRPTYGQTPQQVMDTLIGLAAKEAPKMGAAFRWNGEPLSAIYVDPEKHPRFIGAMQAAYSQITGREPKLMAIGGTTFAKAFPNAVCFGPADMEDEEELAHQVDERISVANLLRNVRIYALAIALLTLED